MKYSSETHILALDVRHSRIGYALFSGPKRLLDWGASTVPSRCSNRARWIRQKMASLLRHGSPVFVITKQRRIAKLPGNANGAPIFDAIRSVAGEHGIPMHLLDAMRSGLLSAASGRAPKRRSPARLWEYSPSCLFACHPNGKSGNRRRTE